MLKQIKDQTFKLLEKYEGKISKVDYQKVKAYIDLLYHFALPCCSVKEKTEKGNSNGQT